MTWDEDYYLGSSDYPLSGLGRKVHEDILEVYGPAPEAEYVPALLDALDGLTAKQRFVIELSWGLRGERAHSFQEIADLMSVSEVAIRKHHAAAMRRLEKEVRG